MENCKVNGALSITDQILQMENFAKCILLQKNFLQNLHYNRYNVLSQIFLLSISSAQKKTIDKNILFNLLIIKLLYRFSYLISCVSIPKWLSWLLS